MSAAPAAKVKVQRRGLTFPRYFTKEGVHPYDEHEWEMRSAVISGPDGTVIFEQHDIEAPKSWSQTAVNIVVQKYFRGLLGTPERETSIKQLIDRVVQTISDWGRKDGFFATEADGDTFEAELTHLMINQMAAFNSPVWFNVGVDEHPQCSACFINSVDDTMDSILTLAHTEGMLFKWGSGTGTNFSSLRSSRENLNGGGTASGPVSFMRGFDAFAGVIKSGGKTRRAAKMVILDIDHPDVVEFIECKAKEERKAWTLIDAGYDPSFNGEAYSSIFFQNSNNSVRLNDEFMQSVLHDRTWHTSSITNGRPVETLCRARELMKKIAEAAWQCGDPGHAVRHHHQRLAHLPQHRDASTRRTRAPSTCSSTTRACNLASLNLRKYQRETDRASSTSRAYREGDRHVLITAQEILVDNAQLPDAGVSRKTATTIVPWAWATPTSALLLMSRGLPYD